jgi:hypothetical protein
MDLETDRIAVGIRFKMSKLGAVRCPNLVDKIRIVVGVSRRTTGVAVLFDGDRRPTYLHRDSLSPASERHQGPPHTHGVPNQSRARA